MTTEQIEEILKHKMCVTLVKPAHGFWDGGAKTYFEFSPSIERTAGPQAIRWGSYVANLWFVVECKQKSVNLHFAAVRRKLSPGKPDRKIELKKL